MLGEEVQRRSTRIYNAIKKAGFLSNTESAQCSKNCEAMRITYFALTNCDLRYKFGKFVIKKKLLSLTSSRHTYL